MSEQFDFSTLITDRSESDVDFAISILKKANKNEASQEEIQNLYNGLLKGLYDFSDLNRVNSCMEFLVSRLSNAGYLISVFLTGPYDREETPTRTEIEQYRKNISAIRNVLTLDKYIPNTPDSMSNLTVYEANAIEQILIAVNGTLDRIEKNIDLGWALGVANVGLYGGV